jgi:hypothetical protein
VGVYYIFDASDGKDMSALLMGPATSLEDGLATPLQDTAEINYSGDAIRKTFISPFSNWFRRLWTLMKSYAGKSSTSPGRSASRSTGLLVERSGDRHHDLDCAAFSDQCAGPAAMLAAHLANKNPSGGLLRLGFREN